MANYLDNKDNRGSRRSAEELVGLVQVERRPNPSDRRSSVVRTLPSGLTAAREHLLPVAAELLEKSAELTGEERAVAGDYLRSVTEIFARHARGDNPPD